MKNMVFENDGASEFETLRERRIEAMEILLADKKMKMLQVFLEENDAFEIAEFFSGLPHNQLTAVFRMLSKELGAEVFAELNVPEQECIINSISDNELGLILEELYIDDTVDMMEELPANVVRRVMKTARPETRALINQYLNYPENSAGSIMTAEYIDLKKYMNVREAFARIRRIGSDKETIYTCFVTSADRKLEGIVSVRDLIMSDEDAILESIMTDNVIYAMTTDDQESVIEMFSDYDLIAVPVVDKEHRLVGIVTVDDVIDVMEEEATEDIEKMAGIMPSDRPYSRTGVVEIWKTRFPWLMLLMLSATFTSMIINGFEDALSAQAALIAFMPMLMGTGGNSGSQASTSVIRSLSIGDTEPSDILFIIWKEIRVAVLCGITLAFINFAKMFLIDKWLLGNAGVTVQVTLTVCFAIVFIVVFAKAVGCTLPIIAEKIGIDPAVMASPLISTVTDAVSLLIYFAIAKLLLKI